MRVRQPVLMSVRKKAAGGDALHDQRTALTSSIIRAQEKTNSEYWYSCSICVQHGCACCDEAGV